MPTPKNSRLAPSPKSAESCGTHEGGRFAPKSDRRRGFLVGASAFALGMLLPFEHEAKASELPELALKLVDQSVASAAGLILARSEGLFTREQLSVQIESHPTTPEVGDHSDNVVLLVSAREYLRQRANGAPLRAFATNHADSPVSVFFRKDRMIRAPEDLVGKSIGYAGDPDSQIIFEWFLQKAGISRAKLKEVPSADWHALISGELDVMTARTGIDDPITLSARYPREAYAFSKAGIGLDFLDPRAYGVHAIGSVYATSEQAFSNADRLVRFLRAAIAGWSLVYDDTAKAARYLPSPEFDSAGFQSALERQRNYLRPGGQRYGEISRSRFSDLYQFMLQRRLVSTQLDFSRAVDERLIVEAYRRR